jgi:hypothetical protein
VFSLVHWKKVAEALFSDSSFVAAGKKRVFAGWLTGTRRRRLD